MEMLMYFCFIHPHHPQVCMLFANIVVKVATVTPYLAWIRWCTVLYFSMAGLIEVPSVRCLRAPETYGGPIEPETCWWKKSGGSPGDMANIPLFMEFTVYIPAGCLGFLPSTVSLTWTFSGQAAFRVYFFMRLFCQLKHEKIK